MYDVYLMTFVSMYALLNDIATCSVRTRLHTGSLRAKSKSMLLYCWSHCIASTRTEQRTPSPLFFPCLYSPAIPALSCEIFVTMGMCLQNRCLVTTGSLGCCSLAINVSSRSTVLAFSHHITIQGLVIDEFEKFGRKICGVTECISNHEPSEYKSEALRLESACLR
jgi:hypothetical protein